MSRKWIEKEGPLWVKKGIVSQEQVEQILELYEDKKHAIGLLPILGSILVGLGILSFVAANWDDIPHLVRLGLIIVLMSGLYAGGEAASRRGHDKLGVALIGLGVISFGAGIVLIGQMFHLVAYDAGSFIIWALAGAITVYLYQSRYLFLLSLILFNVAQWYSLSEFGSFSYTAFVLMLALLGPWVWLRATRLTVWTFTLSITLHAIMWTAGTSTAFMWMFIPVMALYVLGDWIKNKRHGYILQTIPLATAFLFAVFLVLFGDERNGSMYNGLKPMPLYYVPALLFLFAASIAGKLRSKQLSGAFEWILLVPFVFLPSGIEVLYLLAAFVFSLYVLWRGYEEEWRLKINFGTILFIISTMVAYGKLTWNFMDKSLFFVIGGLLLFGLSWFLNRRKKQVLHDAKEDGPHA